MTVLVRPSDHDDVLAVLETGLPPVTLLVGPAGVGKTAIVRWLSVFHGIGELDVMLGERTATMADVRALEAFLSDMPLSARRFVSLDLAGSTDGVQNALLKICEEPPPLAAIILRSTAPVIPTLESRCSVFALGSLSESTLLAVLLEEGFPDDRCIAVSRAAGGSLTRARQLLASFDVRHRVVSLLTVLGTGADDVVLDVVPVDMADVPAVCEVLADVAAWYAVGSVHPLVEDVPVPVDRAVAGALASTLADGRPSRSLLRHALWTARGAR